MAEGNEQEPYGMVVMEDPAGGPEAFRVVAPIVVCADVWASREEEDPPSPITGWVVEYTIGAWSLGFEHFPEKPMVEQIAEEQSTIMRDVRDAVLVMQRLKEEAEGT